VPKKEAGTSPPRENGTKTRKSSCGGKKGRSQKGEKKARRRKKKKSANEKIRPITCKKGREA